MILWITECVTTTSFSISINGSLHGHFKGKRGLRQGDPISPYLFTIVMEVLTLMLKHRVRDEEGFTFHRYCSKMEVINLCFADDLFLFTHGDVQSAKIIMDSLDEFNQIMPFEEGRILVKYLGVPLVPSRLVYRDCKELIEKVEARINDWKNKSLSIAGRLQLVQYVIASMHVFWASVFILPMRILLNIEQLMRSFLWCQGSMRNEKAKVTWNVVCLPKDEGGLGIRRLDFFNKALMSVHVWNLLIKKTSLWVQWVHLYKIKDLNFWDIPCRGNMTWGWCSLSPLANVVSPRDRSRSGLNSTSMVANIMGSGLLEWPPDLGVKYPSLLAIPSPRLYQGILDKLEWRTSLGVVKPFAVSSVWQSIRPRSFKTDCGVGTWFACPYAFKEQYVRCVHGSNPFILLEAVASQDLWIWHAFFGVAGSNNDINVLYQSPLFNDLKTGRAPEIRFVANGVTYLSGYYLVDGIYPELAPLVKTIPEPADDDHKRILYKQKQESARKDVERAFGVLKKKWAILANPTRALKKERIINMMYTCIILHNMIRKYKKYAISPKWFPEEMHQPDDPLRNEEQVQHVMR
ncbi:hypothetical protein Tco_1011492 [Tanacetum coccineum]